MVSEREDGEGTEEIGGGLAGEGRGGKGRMDGGMDGGIGEGMVEVGGTTKGKEVNGRKGQ